MYQGIPPEPEKKFLKDLKQYDKYLDVIFDRKLERFVIVRKPAWGKPVGVLVVAGKEPNFRQPDNREICALALADLWRSGQEAKDRIHKGEQYMQDYADREDQHIRDELRAVSRENKLQLKNIYRKATNTGSKQPEFRRLDTHGPGLTLAEIQAARAAGKDPWAGIPKVK